MNPAAPPPPLPCPKCQAQLAPSLLACPGCGHLVHAGRLNELARQAAEFQTAGNLAGELTVWREALALLPMDTRQAATITQRVRELSARVDAGGAAAPPPPQKGARSKAAAGLGVFALLLWKFKALAVLALAKGKLLLLGLTKATTLFSMLLSLGVYWAAWGWRFAVGVILSIYVHEMGHVIALKRYGFKASAPMFIPGVGALVRLHQHPVACGEDARIGLAGPLYGTLAALLAWGVSWTMQWPAWAAIARVGAWINLFNLLPLWQLDGGRAFNALSNPQRGWALLVIAGAWLWVKDGLLVLLLLMAVVRMVSTRAPEKADSAVGLQYAVLVVILSGMCLIPVPGF